MFNQKVYDKKRYKDKKSLWWYTLSRRMRTIALKKETFNVYGGCICACCGEEELAFLELDHINNNGAAHRKTLTGGKANGAGNKVYQQLKNLGYPPGFQVLCSSCNKGKHLFGGVCPHKLMLDITIDEGEYIDMGWENVNLSEIPLDSKPEPVPQGTYTLQVMGAEESKFRAGAINITTSVADEGPYMGRRVFLDVPNIDEQAWAARIVAGLFSALGVTPTPYSNPIEEINRLAQNGHSRFIAEVGVETFKRNDGTQGSKNKINTRSMRPAA